MSDIFPFMPYMCVLLQIFSIVQNKSYLTGFFPHIHESKCIYQAMVILLISSERKKGYMFKL